MTATQTQQRGEQLSLDLTDFIPPRLRLSKKTVKVGRRGLADVRAVLAEQNARRVVPPVRTWQRSRQAA
jgi:hypothetical protein